MVDATASPITADDRHRVGERLRRVRELNGLSQRELARRAGVPNSSVSMIEQGRVSPSIDTLGRLLDAIPISLAHFFSCNPDLDDSYFYRLAPGVDADGEWLEQLLSRSGGSRRLEVSQQRFLPGADTGSKSLADGDLCSGLLIQGCLEVTLGARVQKLSAGEGFYIGDQSRYRLHNTGSEPALLFIARSAGRQ